MEEEATTDDFEDERLRADQLAACHSLLDSFRRGSRQDLLVSTLVAALARRDGLNSKQLFDSIRRIWHTDAIADTVLERALIDARTAGLVALQEDFEGNERYVVSRDARAEAETDRDYIARLLRQFTTEVSERLREYADASRLVPKAERIANLVVEAIARACDGAYAIDPPSASVWARPDHVNMQPIRTYASGLQPKSIREPVMQLAFDTLDPTDGFGNQIVHLVVVSNLLHGLAAQRGLPTQPALQRMHLLLDTSLLVGLALPPDDPRYRLVVELVTLSNSVGASVVVAEHTLQEWERVWEGADSEEVGQRARADKGLGPREASLVGNPFLSAYMSYRHAGGRDSWQRWQMGRRDIRSRLAVLGATVLEHSNETDEDSGCYQVIHERLMDLSNDPKIYASRTNLAASADACSAVMVAQWRKNLGPNAALMLASDKLTNQAYGEAFTDQPPLVGDPGAWLLYVSNLTSDDPRSVIEIADFVADLAVRNTLLEIASNYSLEEAIDISEVLVEGQNGLTSREIRDLSDPTLFDTLDALQKESAGDARNRAAAVLQRRATRNNRRAAFRESIQSSELESLREEAAQQVSLEVGRAERYKADADVERKRAASAETRSRNLQDDNTRLRRIVYALSVFGLAAIPLLCLVAWGLLNVGAIVVVGLGLCAFGFYAWYWVSNPEIPSARIWLGFASQVCLSLFIAVVF